MGWARVFNTLSSIRTEVSCTAASCRGMLSGERVQLLTCQTSVLKSCVLLTAAASPGGCCIHDKRDLGNQDVRLT